MPIRHRSGIQNFPFSMDENSSGKGGGRGLAIFRIGDDLIPPRIFQSMKILRNGKEDGTQ